MSARVGLAPEAQAFSFYINGGLDKRKLEKNYIEKSNINNAIHIILYFYKNLK